METADTHNESTEEVDAVSMSPSTSLLACPFCNHDPVVSYVGGFVSCGNATCPCTDTAFAPDQWQKRYARMSDVNAKTQGRRTSASE